MAILKRCFGFPAEVNMTQVKKEREKTTRALTFGKEIEP